MNDKFEQYTKRPVTVGACRYDGSAACAKFIVEETKKSNTPATMEVRRSFHEPRVVLRIETLEGLMIVREGDYVIKGIAGEYYPCNPDIFNRLYFPVKMAV